MRSSQYTTGRLRPLFHERAQLPREPGRLALLAFQRERQPHHDAHWMVRLDVTEQHRHGEALPVAPRHRGERRREELQLVAQRDADAPLTPVEGEQAARRLGSGQGPRVNGKRSSGKRETKRGPEEPPSHPLPFTVHAVPVYCAIVAKNSLLFFVRFIRSSRNSSASTGGMSARKLRSRYTRLSSSLSMRSSSLRVDVRWMSMAG